MKLVKGTAQQAIRSFLILWINKKLSAAQSNAAPVWFHLFSIPFLSTEFYLRNKDNVIYANAETVKIPLKNSVEWWL